MYTGATEGTFLERAGGGNTVIAWADVNAVITVFAQYDVVAINEHNSYYITCRHALPASEGTWILHCT